MIDFCRVWIDQCQAARGIEERYGTEKALGYLIGEKLIDFVRVADERADFARELPGFVAEIKNIFEPDEIQEYLENVRRVGPFGHIGTDEEVEFLRQHDVIEESPVRGAEDVLILERIKEMFLA
jgi:hypothetical protein